MAQGNPYARFVEVMKRQGRAMNEPAMTVGIVTGVEPVSISVDGVPIAEHIYCNQVTTSNKDEELAAIFGAGGICIPCPEWVFERTV